MAAGEAASLSGGSLGEAQRVLEHTQAHPPKNQHQGSTWNGVIHLRVAEEVTESRVRAEQVALFPL